LAIETIQAERRSRRRYPLDLQLSFRQIAGAKTVLEGTGKVGDISSAGVLFATPVPPSVGSTIELVIEWPYRGENGSALQLFIIGRVVRRDGSTVAVQTTRHGFRPAASLGSPGGGFLRHTTPEAR
jgi:hypothetical protein